MGLQTAMPIKKKWIEFMEPSSRLKIKLARNLRRSILRGHPWVYKEAVEMPSSRPERARLCQVSDGKGELGWAIFDPHGPLSLRMLCTKKSPPNQTYFEKRFQQAFEIRSHVRSEKTNAYRLFNGEGDGLPGLVCDVYDKVAVLQFDGQGPSEFWDKNVIAEWLLKNTECTSVVEKSRRNVERKVEKVVGDDPNYHPVILENGVKFKVDLELGQKTGFFLDQRDNRDYIRRISSGKSVLNLFSYSGGFSVYAGLGGAARVASVDISKGAIDLALENWQLNGLNPSLHEGLAVDVFEYLSGEGEQWDHIVVDPPSMSHSEAKKETAIAKYIEIFSSAAKRVRPGGGLSLSSCSSHVSMDDFFKVIEEALSQARRNGRIVRVAGQGADHPFPHACLELRYLKFIDLVLD